jgi:hypothetical protein
MQKGAGREILVWGTGCTPPPLRFVWRKCQARSMCGFSATRRCGWAELPFQLGVGGARLGRAACVCPDRVAPPAPSNSSDKLTAIFLKSIVSRQKRSHLTTSYALLLRTLPVAMFIVVPCSATFKSHRRALAGAPRAGVATPRASCPSGRSDGSGPGRAGRPAHAGQPAQAGAGGSWMRLIASSTPVGLPSGARRLPSSRQQPPEQRPGLTAASRETSRRRRLHLVGEALVVPAQPWL